VVIAPDHVVTTQYRRVILAVIVIIGAAVRFYQLDLTWFFLDHVRDVSTATAIATGTNFPLLGPRVGWTEAYLGPLYFYLLAIPFSVAQDPIAGVAFVAFSHLLAVIALYRFATEFFGTRAALYACGFFAVFPLANFSSRLVWHAGLVPPLVVLFVHALFRLIVKGRSTVVLLFVLLAVLTQLHLTAIALAGVGLAGVLAFRPRLQIAHVAVGAGIFAVLYLPYLIYEFTHQFQNIGEFIRFGQSAVSVTGFTSWASVLKNLLLLFSQPLKSFIVDTQWSSAFMTSFWILYGVEALLFGIGIVVCLYRLFLGERGSDTDATATRRQAALLLLWVAVPFVLIHSQTTPIWWYYFDIVYPAPFLLAAIALTAVPYFFSWTRTLQDLTARALAAVAGAIFISQACFLLGFQRIAAEGQMMVRVPGLAINGVESAFETLLTLPLRYRRDIVGTLIHEFGVDKDTFPNIVHGAALGLVEENRYLVSYLSARSDPQTKKIVHPDVHYFVARAVKDNSNLDTIRSARIGPYTVFEYRPRINYGSWSCAASAHGLEAISKWTRLEVPASNTTLTVRAGEVLYCRGRLQMPSTVKETNVTVSLVGWAPFETIALRAGGQLLDPVAQEHRQNPLMLRAVSGWQMGIGWTRETMFTLSRSMGSGEVPVTIELTGGGRLVSFDVYEGKSW